MASITCPLCSAVLKTKDPVPPGKKVKCPKCGGPFVVPEPEEGVAGEKAAGKTAKSPKAAAANNEETAGGDGLSGLGDDDGGAIIKNKNSGKKKSSTTMIIGIVVGVLLLCCCCPTGCGSIWQFVVAPMLAKSAEEALKKQL